jgi:hypothetical protein
MSDFFVYQFSRDRVEAGDFSHFLGMYGLDCERRAKSAAGAGRKVRHLWANEGDSWRKVKRRAAMRVGGGLVYRRLRRFLASVSR